MNHAIKKHWNEAYLTNGTMIPACCEQAPKPSIHLLSNCHLDKNAAILDVGAGMTKFVDYLIDDGYTNITVADIREVAMGRLKYCQGKEKSLLVKWIVDDFTQPEHINQLEDIALWHDRAVLHFLVEECWQKNYFSTLKKIVKKDCYVIIAAFSKGGVKKFGSLDVVNYDDGMLSERLGDGFELIQAFDYLSCMPSGNIGPFIYTLFQKKY